MIVCLADWIVVEGVDLGRVGGGCFCAGPGILVRWMVASIKLMITKRNGAEAASMWTALI